MGKKNQKTLKTPVKINFFDKAENWLEQKSGILFSAICVLCLLFSVLHFNARISEGGDDATYIYAGFQYAKDFTGYFYTFNAPLYPMFLGLPIKFFGINLILLKSISVLFNFFFIFFLYKAFKGKIPYLVLFPVLLFTSVNSYFQYFASQTYNESFFLFFQSLYFYAFVKLYDKLQEHENNLKATYKEWLLLGCTMLILSLSKNVAITAIPAVLLFFILLKEYKNALYAVCSFLVFKIPFEIIKSIVWGATGQFTGQGNILLQKDPYDKSLGQEDLSGFIGRFFDNSSLYLSKRFFQIIGFMKEESTTTNGLLAFLMIALVLFAIFRIWKQRNALMLYLSIYSAVMITTTFFVLQARWDQPRLIMIYIPFLLLIIFFAFYQAAQKFSIVKNIWIITLFIITASSLISSLRKANENIYTLKKNLKGDIYYGYTPDWVNYLKMSEWCGKNLNDTAYVACRKAPMSFIYANGKEFYPVYYVQGMDETTKTVNPDSVLAILQRNKVTHVLIASLRRNPRRADKTFINTLHRMLGPVAEKYPQKVKLVHTEGRVETAELYEIKY